MTPRTSTPAKAATEPVTAVVIPAYRVRPQILALLREIGPEVHQIFVVDDCCPDKSGELVQNECADSRVRVIRNSENLGVGGAVMQGYLAAIAANADIIVKLDGDGQMDPSLISSFVAPIAAGEADYTKGNRFFDLEQIRAMPTLRLFGNAVLSFMAKFSTGYWNLFDPTNGYTAIHRDVARHLPFSRISRRYFFETDMLFRLNTLRAVVVDIPMNARYGDEVSNLRISRIVTEFLYKHVRNFGKRIFYNYYLRDMSIASLELPGGLALFGFGTAYGAYSWVHFSSLGQSTPAGTVMMSALPILLGMQLLLGFLSYDISAIPTRPVHRSAWARGARFREAK